MKIGLTECLSKYYHNNCIYTPSPPPKLGIIMFGKCKGIIPMSFSAPWDDYKPKNYSLT